MSTGVTVSGKQKSRKSVSKRVKVKKSGALFMEKPNHKHRLVAKSARSKVEHTKYHEVAPGDAKALKKAMKI